MCVVCAGRGKKGKELTGVKSARRNCIGKIGAVVACVVDSRNRKEKVYLCLRSECSAEKNKKKKG